MSRAFKRYVYVWGVFSLVNSSDVFLLMKAKASGLTTTTVILLFCAYNVTYSLTSPWLGGLSDKVDRKIILIAGLIVFAFVYLGFGFSSEAWHFWVLFLFYGLYMGATDGVGKSLAVDFSPRGFEATGLGLMGTVTGLCTIFASVVAGMLWDHFGPIYTFVYGASGAIVAATLFVVMNSQRFSERNLRN